MIDMKIVSVSGGWKRHWLDAAEIIDSLRIFPRAVLAFYGWWMARITWRSMTWFEGLKPEQQTGQVVAFMGIALPGIFGLAVWVYKIYAAGGRDWDAGKDADAK